MIHRYSQLASIFLMAAGLTLSSCAFAPVTPPDYYLLPSPQNTVQNDTPLNGVRVSVGPLSLPGYLEKLSIPLRDPNTNQIVMADSAIWGEPLENGITRILSVTISNGLAPDGGVAVPLSSNLRTELRVYLIVSRFDGTLGGTTVLDADWGITTSRGHVLRMGHFAQSVGSGTTLSTMIDGQGQLLTQLGAQLSREIRSLIRSGALEQR